MSLPVLTVGMSGMTTAFKDLSEVRGSLRPTLILVRHGSTDLNKGSGSDPRERARGWKDVPLNADGIKEAHKIAETIENFPVKIIISSDLSRALVTAKTIAAKHPGVRLYKTGLLRPWDLGNFSGRLYTEIEKEMARLQDEDPNEPTPSGESFNVFKHRYLTALKALLAAAKDKPDAGFVVGVAHTRNLRLAHAWVGAGAEKENIDKQIMLSEHLNPGEALVITEINGKWKTSVIKGGPSGRAS